MKKVGIILVFFVFLVVSMNNAFAEESKKQGNQGPPSTPGDCIPNPRDGK